MNGMMTIDDLIQFCEEHQMYSFDSSESNNMIFVRVPAVFEKSNKCDDYTLFGDIKVLHTGKNRNRSNAKRCAVEKAMQKLAYKPLLANFCEIDGVKDFTSHDFVKNEDGSITYLERQIGCFTADEPTLEYDEENDRYYLNAKVAIPRQYTDAAEIIERKGGTKTSAELAIFKMSYDAVNKSLDLEDFEITGATCLGVDPETGEPVNEGMEGSRIDIADFSQSITSEVILDENLDNYIKAFNADIPEEGGKQMFNELLEKYGKTVEDITFEYENMTDEELVAAFAEAFEPAATPELSVTLGERNFSINLSDVIYALSQLVNDTYAEDGTYYAVSVYDGSTNKERYVIMQDWYTGSAFRQSYKVKDDNYILVGERVPVFSVWVTTEEKEQLESMKANYAEVCDKLAKYEAEPEKQKILCDECFAQIAEEDSFTELKENHFDLSVDEVQKKADEILLSFAKQGKIQSAVHVLPAEVSQKKISRYGNLFD